jgi:hypothetical protein
MDRWSHRSIQLGTLPNKELQTALLPVAADVSVLFVLSGPSHVPMPLLNHLQTTDDQQLSFQLLHVQLSDGAKLYDRQR